MIPLEERRLSSPSPPIISETSIYLSPPSPMTSQPRASSPLTNFLYILIWYFFSTALSLFNKNLMGRDHYNLNLPLLVSAIHTGLHWLITGIIINVGGERWRGKKGRKVVSWEVWSQRVVSDSF